MVKFSKIYFKRNEMTDIKASNKDDSNLIADNENENKSIKEETKKRLSIRETEYLMFLDEDE